MQQLIVLSPPGRFPTVVRDPGEWWAALTRTGAHVERPGLNAAWWRTLCDPSVAAILMPRRRGRLDLGHRRAERTAGAAADALARFRQVETYASASRYVEATGALADHLDALNDLDPELRFGPDRGVRVAGLRYGSSERLVAYASADTGLARIIERTLDDLPLAAEAALVEVSSPEDLLTALIAVRLLRARGQIRYAALVDHGYENFSLSPYLPALRGAGTLDSVFDAIVEEKDDRETVVPRIVEGLVAGRPLRGYLRLDPAERTPSREVQDAATAPVIAPPVPTFAPWPILFARVSQRRCYWARCTFCVHNLKYVDRAAPSTADVPRAVRRLRAAAAAGYRQIILADEALSPAMLRALGAEILGSGLLREHPDFRWACRSKLERSHDTQLLTVLGEAGCAEILFGLESTSDRVLGLMDKRSPGLTTTEVVRIVSDMDAAGIGAHANLIVGFPGDTPEEAGASVAFLADALAPLRNATYTVNPFALFPGTPVAQEAPRFGIELLPTTDDIPFELPYRPTTKETERSEAVRDMQPCFEDWLAERLGWRNGGHGDHSGAAQEMYFGSGHGLVFKASDRNPMDRTVFARHAGGERWSQQASS